MVLIRSSIARLTQATNAPTAVAGVIKLGMLRSPIIYTSLSERSFVFDQRQRLSDYLRFGALTTEETMAERRERWTPLSTFAEVYAVVLVLPVIWGLHLNEARWHVRYEHGDY